MMLQEDFCRRDRVSLFSILLHGCRPDLLNFHELREAVVFLSKGPTKKLWISIVVMDGISIGYSLFLNRSGKVEEIPDSQNIVFPYRTEFNDS